MSFLSVISLLSRADHDAQRRHAGAEGSVYLHGEGQVIVTEFLKNECFRGFKPPRVSSENLKRFQKFLEKVKAVQTSGGSWSERPMYTPLVNSLVDISENAVRARPLPLRFHTCADLRPLDPAGGVRGAPDIVIHEGNRKASYWGRSLAFVEVKATKEEDPFYNMDERKERRLAQTEIWNQIQEYAAISFRSIPPCFLLAIGIFGDTARFFRWDRSTVIVSEGFNYKAHPEHLVHFLAGLSGYANGGIDATADAPITARTEQDLVVRQYEIARDLLVVPEYKTSQNGDTLIKDSRRMQIPSQPQIARRRKFDTFLTLGPPVFTSKSIFGRGTRVWLATKATPTTGGKECLVIIKDSWREKDRWKEGEIYDKIYKPGEHVRGMARLYMDYDIAEDKNDEVHRTSASRLNARSKGKRFKELIHHRVVLSSVGIPLSRFTSTRLLLEAVRDAIEGHETMCARNVLHRDISVNNIMISADVDAEGGAKGFLIDPELAAATGMDNLQEELNHLTGTYQFTSMQRFDDDPGQHASWNDLESFYWVVLYVVLRHTVSYVQEDRKRVGADHLLTSLYDSGGVSSERKKTFLKEKTSNFVVEGNAPLTKCLLELGEMVYSHYPDKLARRYAPREELDRLTHDNVLSVINQALASEDWPVGDKAIPFFPIERPNIQENKDIGRALEGCAESWTMPLPPHPVRVKPNEPSPSHAASAFNGGSADAKAPSPMSSQKGENLPFEKKANGTGLRRSARLDQLKINGQKQQKRPRSDEQAPAAPAKPTVKRSRRQHAHDVPVRRSQRIATSTTASKGREAAKVRATAPRSRSTRNP